MNFAYILERIKKEFKDSLINRVANGNNTNSYTAEQIEEIYSLVVTETLIKLTAEAYEMYDDHYDDGHTCVDCGIA